MRVLVAVMVSIMLCLQPMISLNESNKNYKIVSFSSLQESSVSDNWWEDTNMDKDKNRMHDMLDIALEQGRYVVDGKISVLVDFDHMPTESDEQLLIDEVGFEPSWRFHHIPIIAGTIQTDLLDELLNVEGVVFLTLNGEMRMTLDNAIGIHHADTVWDLGYTGEGMIVAVADTGVDFAHPDLNGTQARVDDSRSDWSGWPMMFDHNSMYTYLVNGNAYPQSNTCLSYTSDAADE